MTDREVGTVQLGEIVRPFEHHPFPLKLRGKEEFKCNFQLEGIGEVTVGWDEVDLEDQFPLGIGASNEPFGFSLSIFVHTPSGVYPPKVLVEFPRYFLDFEAEEVNHPDPRWTHAEDLGLHLFELISVKTRPIFPPTPDVLKDVQLTFQENVTSLEDLDIVQMEEQASVRADAEQVIEDFASQIKRERDGDDDELVPV